MLQIAICDDDALHIAYIKRLTEDILKEKKIEITEYSGANELLFKIDGSDYIPDIALLDIQMPDIDGISLAKELNQIAPDCKIIFISSYLNYAPDVYDADHIYYVLKTQLEDRLPIALGKAVASINSPHNFLLVKCGTSTTKIPVGRVLYIERNLHKTNVITSETTYTTSQSPADLLSAIAVKSTFIHCHQSYWVNSKAIKTMGSNSFLLYDGTEIPISRAQKSNARELFFRSLAE